jgi:membrane associated rhomboid family serine protease
MAKPLENLVQKYGVNSNSFLCLYPGHHYFYLDSPSGETGCITYVRTKTAWVGLSEPLAATEDRLRLLKAFAEEARLDGKAAVFLPVGDVFKDEAKKAGFRSLQIGSEPYFNLKFYPPPGKDWFDVSRSAKALLGKGFRVNSFSFSSCKREVKTEISEVLQEWVESRKMGELGFVNRVEPELLSDLKAHFYVENQGRIFAFLSAIPISPVDGWYFIDVIRRKETPAGCVELLMLQAMRMLKDQGFKCVSLGVSPLSREANLQVKAEEQPWHERLGTYFFDHFQWFYNFKSLFDFKKKFHPSEWRGAHVIHNFNRTDHRLLLVLMNLFVPQGGFLAVVQMIKRKTSPRILIREAKSWVSDFIILRANPKSVLIALARAPISCALVLVISLTFFGTAGAGLRLSSYWTEHGAYSAALFSGFSNLSLEQVAQIFVFPAFLHWNVTHIFFNLLTLVLFCMNLEIFLGSGILLMAYFAAVLFANPVTSLLMWIFFQATHFGFFREALNSLDVGASLGIWSCAGAWSYLLKNRMETWILFVISVICVSMLKGDLLQMNHIVAAAIGYAVAYAYFGRVRFST